MLSWTRPESHIHPETDGRVNHENKNYISWKLKEISKLVSQRPFFLLLLGEIVKEEEEEDEEEEKVVEKQEEEEEKKKKKKEKK